MDGAGDELRATHHVTLTGLPKPEALRELALAVGARYAGDGTDDTITAHPSPPPRPVVPIGTRQKAMTPLDRRAADVLDQMPVAAIVVARGVAVFANRAAVELLGDDAAALEAAGGLESLFTGEAPVRGSLRIARGSRAPLDAVVRLGSVPWGFGQALLLTVVPADEPATTAQETNDAVLLALVEDFPAPVAIISPDGVIEAANAGFGRGDQQSGRRLDERVSPSDLNALTSAIDQALTAHAPKALTATLDGTTHTVSVHPLESDAAACVVFHPRGEAPMPQLAVQWTAPQEEGPVDRAVTAARKLLRDAVVLVLYDRPPEGTIAADRSDEVESFFRALLLALGARAPAGSVIRLEREARRYRVALPPDAQPAVPAILASGRIVLSGLNAGLALSADDGTLTIAPLLPQPSPTSPPAAA